MNWDHFDELNEDLTESELDEILDEDDMEQFEEDFPELYEAVRDSMRENPRAIRILTEVVQPKLKEEIGFIGSDPAEIDVSEMDAENSFEALMDVLSGYAWVSLSEVFDLQGDITERQFEELGDMDEERQRKYFNEVFMEELEEGSEREEIEEEIDFEDFLEILEVGGGIGNQMVSMFAGEFEEIPEKGDLHLVEAPPIHLLGEPDAIGALHISETEDLAASYEFETIWPRSFVLQKAEVVGFETYDDDELNAVAYPELRVQLPNSNREWIIPHSESHGKMDEEDLDTVIPVEERNDKLFSNGRIPKGDETWLVSVPENYEEYAVESSSPRLENYETYPPEDGDYTEQFRATVGINCDREDEVLDMSYHPYIHVELEEGTEIALPPKAFNTKLD